MPRIARAKSSTGEYHVMMRGINHQKIFNDDDDLLRLLKIIYDLKQKTFAGNSDDDWCILAYAFMGNHVHLFVKVGAVSVGNVVKKIFGTYVQYYNHKYGRDGHLFKERFKSEVCEDDDYFVTLMRYIHQNPIKAGLVSNLEDYEFTSWHEYIGDGKNKYNICNVQYVLDRINIDTMRELVLSLMSDSIKCIDFEDERKRGIMDDEVKFWLLKRTGLKSLADMGKMDKKEKIILVQEMRRMGCTVRQICRILQMSIGSVVRLSK